MYLPIFLLVFLPSKSSFLCCFLSLGEFSLATFRIGLLVTNSLYFPQSNHILISALVPKDTFTGIGFWVDSSFLSVLEKYCDTPFWSPWFLVRNLLSFELFSPIGNVFFFSRMLSRLFLFAFSFFELVLCGFHLPFLNLWFISLAKFSAIIIYKNFISLTPFFSSSRTLMTGIFAHLL